MPRLIDADHLEIIKFTVTEENEYAIGWNEAIAAIKDNAPSIDPVHAAGGRYCYECKYWTGGFDGRCLMHSRGKDVIWYSYASDFCRRGERREENDTI